MLKTREGSEFTELKTGSVHNVVPPPKGCNNPDGVWIMGKTETTRLLPGEWELEHRFLLEIAYEIDEDWDAVYFGAKPHLRAMFFITDINSMYGNDSAREIVLRFLSNARSWKGSKAREIKLELKTMLK